LHAAVEAGLTWCKESGAQSVGDIVEADCEGEVVKEFVAALELRLVPRKLLAKALVRRKDAQRSVNEVQYAATGPSSVEWQATMFTLQAWVFVSAQIARFRERFEYRRRTGSTPSIWTTLMTRYVSWW